MTRALDRRAWLAAAGLVLAGRARATRSRVADVPVQTQQGRALRFYTDLVKNRVVAVNFIFTGCSTICPLLGSGFAQVQTQLGRLGAPAGPVGLLSVSLDPDNDTPARLAEWSHKLGARPGWTLVTGRSADLQDLRASLGASSADPASHSPLVLLIDDRRGGTWQRLDGLTDPALMARMLRSRVEPQHP
jgi:protein SCO1